MEHQSAFKERFEDMENTRNQRLSLLQEEKELHKNKSLVLSTKHSNIRLLERRCLILDQRFASDNFKNSTLQSEIELLERKHETCSQQLRDLKDRVEELEKLDNDREKCYTMKCVEMNQFRDKTRMFAADIRINVEELRRGRDELKLLCSAPQKNNADVQSLDIQAAEIRNSELLALKKKMTSTLESNKRERSELQKQLQCLR